jgi:hypothetical protein
VTRKVLQCLAVWRKLSASTEYIASIFKFEAKQETRKSKVPGRATRPLLFIALQLYPLQNAMISMLEPFKTIITLRNDVKVTHNGTPIEHN